MRRLEGLAHRRSVCGAFGRQLSHRSYEITELPAFFLHLAFLLSDQHLLVVIVTAQSKPNDGVGAAPPEGGGARPVAPREIICCHVVEAEERVRMIVAERALPSFKCPLEKGFRLS